MIKQESVDVSASSSQGQPQQGTIQPQSMLQSRSMNPSTMISNTVVQTSSSVESQQPSQTPSSSQVQESNTSVQQPPPQSTPTPTQQQPQPPSQSQQSSSSSTSMPPNSSGSLWIPATSVSFDDDFRVLTNTWAQWPIWDSAYPAPPVPSTTDDGNANPLRDMSLLEYATGLQKPQIHEHLEGGFDLTHPVVRKSITSAQLQHYHMSKGEGVGLGDGFTPYATTLAPSFPIIRRRPVQSLGYNNVKKSSLLHLPHDMHNKIYIIPTQPIIVPQTHKVSSQPVLISGGQLLSVFIKLGAPTKSALERDLCIRVIESLLRIDPAIVDQDIYVFIEIIRVLVRFESGLLKPGSAPPQKTPFIFHSGTAFSVAMITRDVYCFSFLNNVYTVLPIAKSLTHASNASSSKAGVSGKQQKTDTLRVTHIVQHIDHITVFPTDESTGDQKQSRPAEAAPLVTVLKGSAVFDDNKVLKNESDSDVTVQIDTRTVVIPPNYALVTVPKHVQVEVNNENGKTTVDGESKFSPYHNVVVLDDRRSTLDLVSPFTISPAPFNTPLLSKIPFQMPYYASTDVVHAHSANNSSESHTQFSGTHEKHDLAILLETLKYKEKLQCFSQGYTHDSNMDKRSDVDVFSRNRGILISDIGQDNRGIISPLDGSNNAVDKVYETSVTSALKPGWGFNEIRSSSYRDDESWNDTRVYSASSYPTQARYLNHYQDNGRTSTGRNFGVRSKTKVVSDKIDRLKTDKKRLFNKSMAIAHHLLNKFNKREDKLNQEYKAKLEKLVSQGKLSADVSNQLIGSNGRYPLPVEGAKDTLPRRAANPLNAVNSLKLEMIARIALSIEHQRHARYLSSHTQDKYGSYILNKSIPKPKRRRLQHKHTSRDISVVLNPAHSKRHDQKDKTGKKYDIGTFKNINNVDVKCFIHPAEREHIKLHADEFGVIEKPKIPFPFQYSDRKEQEDFMSTSILSKYNNHALNGLDNASNDRYEVKKARKMPVVDMDGIYGNNNNNSQSRYCTRSEDSLYNRGPGLRHWSRGAVESQDVFSKFRRTLKLQMYTEYEYTQLLTNPQWTRRQTDKLMELADTYNLNFVVMHDRMRSDEIEMNMSVPKKQVQSSLKIDLFSDDNKQYYESIISVLGGNTSSDSVKPEVAATTTAAAAVPAAAGAEVVVKSVDGVMKDEDSPADANTVTPSGDTNPSSSVSDLTTDSPTANFNADVKLEPTVPMSDDSDVKVVEEDAEDQTNEDDEEEEVAEVKQEIVPLYQGTAAELYEQFTGDFDFRAVNASSSEPPRVTTAVKSNLEYGLGDDVTMLLKQMGVQMGQVDDIDINGDTYTLSIAPVPVVPSESNPDYLSYSSATQRDHHLLKQHIYRCKSNLPLSSVNELTLTDASIALAGVLSATQLDDHVTIAGNDEEDGIEDMQDDDEGYDGGKKGVVASIVNRNFILRNNLVSKSESASSLSSSFSSSSSSAHNVLLPTPLKKDDVTDRASKLLTYIDSIHSQLSTSTVKDEHYQANPDSNSNQDVVSYYNPAQIGLSAIMQTSRAVVPVCDKTVEDLKERFYSIQRVLSLSRMHKEGDLNVLPWVQVEFFKDYEVNRKKQLSNIFSRSSTTVHAIARAVLELQCVSGCLSKLRKQLKLHKQKQISMLGLSGASSAYISASSSSSSAVTSMYSQPHVPASEYRNDAGLYTSNPVVPAYIAPNVDYGNTMKHEYAAHTAYQPPAPSQQPQTQYAPPVTPNTSVSVPANVAATLKTVLPLPYTLTEDTATLSDIPESCYQDSIKRPLPGVYLRSLHLGNEIALQGRLGKKLETELYTLGYKKANPFSVSTNSSALAYDQLRNDILASLHLQKHLQSREQVVSQLKLNVDLDLLSACKTLSNNLINVHINDTAVKR